MQEDTVGNGAAGYTACETCNEDAKQEVFELFFFFRDHCRGQREAQFIAAFHTITKQRLNKKTSSKEGLNSNTV